MPNEATPRPVVVKRSSGSRVRLPTRVMVLSDIVVAPYEVATSSKRSIKQTLRKDRGVMLLDLANGEVCGGGHRPQCEGCARTRRVRHLVP